MNELHPYPSPETRDDELRALTAAAGGEVVRYGDSVQGRPLLAGRLPSRPEAPAPPRVLVTGNIHGLEFVSSRVVMGLLARIDRTDALASLRARAEIWVIPCVNPDAYARTFAAGGRGSASGLRVNANGVDLNRNFVLPPGGTRRWWPGAGSQRKGDATYIGPHPLSEPESAALAGLLADRSFHAGANVHSFLGKTIPARVVTENEFAAYKELCATFARAQPRKRYGRLSSRRLDTFTGELEDFQHHHHHMWAICVETFSVGHSLAQHLRAPSPFWRFNPRDPEPWVENDVPAIAAFLHAALDRPRPAR